MSPPILSVQNLQIALPIGSERHLAVDDVSVQVAPSEIVCIVGESGSGKSMVANAVMGLLPPLVRPTGGRIVFEGENLLEASDEHRRSLRGRRIGMIFQEPLSALNPLMRVGRQIDEVFEAHGRLTSAERRRRVVDLLDQVHLPEPQKIQHSYPFKLSGGQRQRVMIAMALALDPSLLIADEPTTALDVSVQAQILKLIKEVQHEHGTGVLFITHDFGVVADIADRIVVMQHGKVVEEGRADAVLGRPKHAYTHALLHAVPSMTPPERPKREGARPLLAVENLVKTYGSSGWFKRGRVVQAAKEVSFAIAEGETLGLVGESGSGKSTVGRCIVRLLDPDAGKLMFDGIDLAPLDREHLRPYRRAVQMVFQDPYASLNPRHRVVRTIADGPIARGTAPGKAFAKARELLEVVGLDANAGDRYPHEFSGGQRQRIGIARALALEPDLLVADEPVSALDVSVQAQILDLLADLKERLGLSMLFITHDLRVAAQVCDRVAVMQHGEIVELAATEEIFRAPQHPYTRSLFAAMPGRHLARPDAIAGA